MKIIPRNIGSLETREEDLLCTIRLQGHLITLGTCLQHRGLCSEVVEMDVSHIDDSQPRCDDPSAGGVIDACSAIL